jgi:hypothetical protein
MATSLPGLFNRLVEENTSYLIPPLSTDWLRKFSDATAGYVSQHSSKSDPSSSLKMGTFLSTGVKTTTLALTSRFAPCHRLHTVDEDETTV